MILDTKKRNLFQVMVHNLLLLLLENPQYLSEHLESHLFLRTPDPPLIVEKRQASTMTILQSNTLPF